MVRVAIALGSNLGDRHATLRDAIGDLAAHVTDLRASTFHSTAPVGVDSEQPMFLNAAVVGRTTLEPRALLDAMLAIERRHGRERPFWGAARTLDLDLILYNLQVIDDGGLTVPHPRFRERRFVLAPLAEIAPDWIDPVTGKRVDTLLSELPDE